MLKGIKAVIFDMDGVIIDSEPIWRKVMIESFVEIGIPFTEDDCRVTTGLRFKEVAAFWFEKFGISSISIDDFDKLVIDKMCQQIKDEGTAMLGVMDSLRYFKDRDLQIGIATSSNNQLMNTVVDALNIRKYFDALCSAEFMDYGKPHPEVYLTCAHKLQVNPNQCLVIEDSVNGIISGKAAQMKVMAIPEEVNKSNPKFAIADYTFSSLTEFLLFNKTQ